MDSGQWTVDSRQVDSDLTWLLGSRKYSMCLSRLGSMVGYLLSIADETGEINQWSWEWIDLGVSDDVAAGGKHRGWEDRGNPSSVKRQASGVRGPDTRGPHWIAM